ncbi:plasmid mobilization relaxosome protein MobC [Vibrio parahaemolyticus]|nr:plasmid mobilization relaxosome protein MobC [Vibrio parahaemolyticus]
MSKQEVVKTRLSETEKKAWQGFCRANNLSESDMLRRVIQRISNETVSIDSPGLNYDKKARKITIRLTEYEDRKLIERAEKEGYTTRTKWTTAVVQSALHKAPILSNHEINVLRESNRELAAIGRNLNQVVKALNIDFHENDKIKQDAIENLIERIEQHKGQVAELIDRNMNRWEKE